MSKLDIAKLAARLAQLNEDSNRGSGGGMSFLTIKDGRNVIRILPGAGDKDFYEEVWVHYGVGKGNKDNAKGTMVVCPTTKDETAKCPVCELSSELKKLSNKKDDSYDKQAKSLYRKKRVYYNSLNRDEDLSVFELQGEGDDAKWVNTKTGEEESPVKVYGSGVGVFKDILKLIVDPEYGDVTDAEEGLDLIITKSGSGQFNTEYDVKTVRRESPIGYEHWEKALADLSVLSKPKTYDEIAQIMDPSSKPDAPSTEEVNEAMESLPDKTVSEDEDAELQAEIKAALARKRG